MNQLPFIPETAPFTAEQRAWLNGFLAGLFSQAAQGQLPPPESAAPPPGPAEPLLVLFGSQTGSAEGLARRVAKVARQRGFAPKVLALNDYEQVKLAAGGKGIILSSTWGDGDPPDNAAAFWTWLNSDTAPRLENLQYAVLGLGDKNYAEFCGASKKFDARLEALGARRLVPRGECDVDYETTAKTWLDTFWTALGSGLANGSRNHATQELSVSNEEKAPAYDKANPFPAKTLRKVLLTQPGSAKEVRHYELSLAGSGLNYEVGDALGVLPVNCDRLVDCLLARLDCRAEELVQAGGKQLPLREALLRHYDITKPSLELLKVVAERLPGSSIARLLEPEQKEELKKWLWGRDVFDVLSLLPELLSAQELLTCLRKLAPRLYSISSSPNAHPGEVHLTVSTVRYTSYDRDRKGVASTFLADRTSDTDLAGVFVQPAHGFKLPSNETPMIMVGPGTGIAPFRAFLEERQFRGARGKNWLIFGDQKRATDFLYEPLITSWVGSGLLSRLDLAFSRDQPEKIYVQDRLRENAFQLWSWLEEGAHFYVCGDASRMARDVDTALHEIIQTAGGKSPEQAQEYVRQLKSQKRYQRDVY